jgi:adenylate cyclase, class 2
VGLWIGCTSIQAAADLGLSNARPLTGSPGFYGLNCRRILEDTVAEETEVKIEMAAMGEFRERLMLLTSAPLSEKHFEDNFLLDYEDGRLRKKACLIRVRKTSHKETVTFKGPPKPSLLFKSREELETRVESADLMLEILRSLGLEVWFRYQKYREEFMVLLTADEGGTVTIALDSTPIGDYVELEGTERGIREVAARLGCREDQFLRSSYHSMFLDFCRRHTLVQDHMVFSDESRQS